MELKHITRLTWNDLPGIENPFFACGAIESDYSSATPLGFFRIRGLGEALGKHASRHSPHAPQPDLRKSLGWLLDRVENGEYILVHTDSNWTAPMASVLRWGTENNRNGFQVSPPGGKKPSTIPKAIGRQTQVCP